MRWMIVAGIALAASGCGTTAGASLSEHEQGWFHGVDEGSMRRNLYYCVARDSTKQIAPRCYQAEFITPLEWGREVKRAEHESSQRETEGLTLRPP